MEVVGAAYVLHRRPYRNNSAIVDFFMRDAGRFSAVVRAQRSPKSKGGSVCEPFRLLDLHCKGRGELLNALRLEALEKPVLLSGKSLYCGLYINELLTYFLPQQDACPEIFDQYSQLLFDLSGLDDPARLEQLLRFFELNMLDSLGYGLELECTCNGESIESDRDYCYRVNEGFSVHTGGMASGVVVAGDVIQSLCNRRHLSEAARQSAKKLLRYVIASHMGGRQLKARELFL